jgi:hypothetical protein
LSSVDCRQGHSVQWRTIAVEPPALNAPDVVDPILIGEFLVVVVRGGLKGGDPTFAGPFRRPHEESFSDFKERVVARAAAAGKTLLVIGGLPIDI